MQYHLNGFRPGDPAVCDPDPEDRWTDSLPGEVDVLVVGCGPAGLTLAAQLAAFPQITTRIVEQKGGPLEKGQADGISVRSMEMFNAFGFAHRVAAEGYRVNEVTFWKPDPRDPGRICRIGRVRDVEEGLSEMPHMIQNQARIHDMYLELMANAPTRLHPDYNREVTGLQVAESGSHPVTVTLRHTDGGETETLRARYVVGCDGARSTVRQAIGRRLSGDSAHQAWGVMDILAVTDFPDIRFKCIIQSDSEGSLLLIPREGGHMVRIYVELDKLSADERVSARDITSNRLVSAANRILSPYTLDVKDVVWWSVYEIGHRLTDGFDDAVARDKPPRVFIAGDACHTHSPKAGQGMNVSMGDTFNLGWKLISVLIGRAEPDLLRSYSEERHAVAQALIDFDHAWSRIISERADRTGGDTPRFQQHFIDHGRYTAGVSVRYAPSRLTGDGTYQALAPGFAIGTRFHSAPVLRLCDAKPMHLGHVIEADARWRIFAFCDATHPGEAGSTLHALCRFLERDPRSPLLRHQKPEEPRDALFDLRAVFQQSHDSLSWQDLPELLRPAKGRLGLRDPEKGFCADPAPGRNIFRMRQINRARGCLVIVRPDQYVAQILPLQAHDALAGFFAGIFRDMT